VYYVATTGSDSNPGSEAQPWRTIQKAASTLVAGDTVYIRAGTYQERVEPLHSGSADHSIHYAAYPGDTVTIEGASLILPEWNGLFDILGKAYIRVSGLRIMNAGPTPHNPGIQVDHSTHIVVENNYVYHTSDSGIAVWNSGHVIVDGNEVEGACYGGFNESISVGGTDTFEVRSNHVHHSQKEGIDAKDGSANGMVFGNEVDHTDSVGIYVDAWDKHTYNIEVFQNVVHDVSGSGIELASEQGGLLEGVRVYNNLAYDNAVVGLSLSTCCIATHPVSGIQIVNNTFYRNGRDPWGGGIFLENVQVQGVVVRNNICSQNLLFQIVAAAGAPAGSVTIDYNLIDGFRGEEGETYGDHHVEGDPRFANPAAGDLHLQADSPAIDQGTVTGTPATDYDGQARPDGAGYDIGADEYQSLNACPRIDVTQASACVPPTSAV
jgi:parallel beta-helix repeat protein